jgi:hypothetical protein
VVGGTWSWREGTRLKFGAHGREQPPPPPVRRECRRGGGGVRGVRLCEPSWYQLFEVAVSQAIVVHSKGGSKGESHLSRVYTRGVFMLISFEDERSGG